MKESVDCLVEREAAIKQVPVGGSGDNDRQLSLIVSRGQTGISVTDADIRVSFVYWLPLKRLVGKVVPVDADGLVHHVPNFIKSEEDFSAAEVLHPAVGAQMRKARDAWEHVSATSLRLKSMFDVGLASSTGFEEWSTSECYICKKNGFDAVKDESGAHDSPVVKCPLCLLCCHIDCMHRLHEGLPKETGKRKKMFKIAHDKFSVTMIPASLFSTTSSSEAYSVHFPHFYKETHILKAVFKR